MTLPFNHAKLSAMEVFLNENNIEQLVRSQIGIMRLKVCSATDEHMEIASGSDKGKCKYCKKDVKSKGKSGA